MFSSQGGHRLGDGSGYNPAPGDPDDCMDMAVCVPVGGCLCITLLLGLLATTSLGAVPPLHYAIRYNAFTKAAATESIYGPGRYVIGPFNSFLLFPSSVQNLEFISDSGLRPSGKRYDSLHTRTKEGLGLHLQLSLQYRLQKENIGKLYTEFNVRYQSVFTSGARDTLVKAASEYNAEDLWARRKEFGERMQQMVAEQLNKTYADCWNLQLTSIDLPDSFEDSLTRTQVQEQTMLLRQKQQISTKIRAETSVIQAQYDRQVKVTLAAGQANYTVQTQHAEAEARQLRIDTESGILELLQNTLELSTDDLVTYQRYGALDQLPEARVLYGFAGSQQLLIRPQGNGR